MPAGGPVTLTPASWDSILGPWQARHRVETQNATMTSENPSNVACGEMRKPLQIISQANV